MIDILFKGQGHDSQRVIDAVDPVVSCDVGYRFEPASRNEHDTTGWGVRCYADSVDESAVVEAVENEFGPQTQL